MTLATLYITALRVIHIFAAVTWVGGGIFFASVVLPTVKEAEQDGARFMLRLAAAGRMSRNLTISAVLTVLAGALLFWPTSGGLNSAWLKTPSGISLTIGAIIGILAAGDGAFRTGRIAQKLGLLASDILARKGPPPPELLQQAQALGAKLQSGAMLSVALGALALFFMAASPAL